MNPEELAEHRKETKELFDRMRNRPETAKETQELEEMRLAALADFPELATTPTPSPAQRQNTSPTSVMLTPSEQESLRQDAKDANAYFQKVFKKPVQ
jgi:hypothetical protein